jgi:hypothetical protein
MSELITQSSSQTAENANKPLLQTKTTNEERKPIKTIVIANNREYFSPIDVFVPEKAKREFIEADFDEGDMDIMWHGDDKIVLLPRQIEPEFTKDIFRIFGYKNTRLIVPHETGAGLSEDIVADKGAFQTVIDAINESPDPQVVTWGYTSQFQRLRGALNQTGVRFRTPETPTDEGLRTPDYLDTKVGSRELLLRVKSNNPSIDIKMPEGYICETVDKAFYAALELISRGKGAVFKANLGGSGIGVNVFAPNKVDTPKKIEVMRKKILGNELFLKNKIVVEECIDADFIHHGTYPSVDSMIREDGSIEIQAVDSMVIHHEGEDVEFYGCIGGKGLFTPKQYSKLYDFTYAVGQEISNLGYRGWYDTDYILAKDGQFSPTEANLRRTSMCYAVDLAKFLYGESWEKTVSIRSNDKFIRPNLHGISYSQLKELLSDILYPMEGEKEGVIISESVRSKFGRGKFGYLIFGDGQDRTKEIEERLESSIDRI